MFCRAGLIADIFIPIDHTSGRKQGSVFVRFAHKWQVDLVSGRSWGGQRIVPNLAYFISGKYLEFESGEK